MVILLDMVCIRLLGKLLPFMDGGAIFIVAKKRPQRFENGALQ